MRFGLLGTGPWARRTQAPGLAAHPDADLVGVWGRDPAKAAALAQEVGARPYEDVDALLAEVDAVAVALPPDVQAPLAERAARAGRHLLLDKPLALDPAAADRVVAAAEAAGVRSVVFHTARFTPEGAAWVDAAQAAGELHGGAMTWLASIAGGPYDASPWRKEKGALWDIGPHALDALVSTLGPVDRLVAASGRGDTAHLVLHHAGGASSTATVTLTAPPEAALHAAWVYGPAGVLTRPVWSVSHPQALGRAVDALQADRPHPSDARHAAAIVHLLARAQDLLDGGA